MSTDSQEALHPGGVTETPPSDPVIPQARPPLFPSPVPSEYQPRRASVHTQQPPHDRCTVPSRHLDPSKEDSVDQEVSRIIRSGYRGNRGRAASRASYPRQLKKYHSADVQCRRPPPLLPRPSSWLDDPRRHSIEVCPWAEGSPQRSSASSGFVSRTNSLQQPSPRNRKKKKMSPPCISIDPPDGPERPEDLRISTGTGAGTIAPPVLGKDTCLRRRAPSSESKDSFDLGADDGLLQEGLSNPKLLTLPNFEQ